MRKTIVARIAVFQGVIFLILAILMVNVVQERARHDSRQEMERHLLHLARFWSYSPPDKISARIAAELTGTSKRLSLIDTEGRVIFTVGGSGSSQWLSPGIKEIEEARVKGEGISWRYDPELARETLSVAVPLPKEVGAGFLHLTEPWVKPGMRLSLIPLMSILIAAMVFLLLSVFFIRRLFAPLKIIESYTRKASQTGRPPMLVFPEEGELGQIADNINDWRRAQERLVGRLTREKATAEAVIASLPEGVMILDDDYRIEAINARMVDILGDKSNDPIGKTPLAVLRNTALWDTLRGMDSTAGPLSMEINRGPEEEQILEVTIALVRDLPLGQKKTLLVFHEITRLRQLEKIRSDFVANLAHELKTPLAALVGISETLLADKPAKKTLDEFLGKINHHSLRLNRLVDDLFILSQVEQGQYPLDFRELKVKDLLDEALALLEDRISAKNLFVTNNVSPEAVIWADRDGVFRIFLNILDNAVKFTAEGQIEITAQTEIKDGVAVRVADTGIGIPAGEIPRLGERFYRVDKTRSREMGGAGLGLSIVRHLLQRHGGRMTIQSKPASGTTVILFFPSRRQDDKPVHIF